MGNGTLVNREDGGPVTEFFSANQKRMKKTPTDRLYNIKSMSGSKWMA